jgi:hypothetical protein
LELAEFVAEGLPNCVLLADIRAAPASEGQHAFPTIPVTTEENGEETFHWVPTYPLDPSGLPFVLALLEGPDLVGMHEGNGSSLKGVLEELFEQAARGKPKQGAVSKGGKGGLSKAHLLKNSSNSVSPESMANLPEMSALWIRWKGGKETDPEEAVVQMLQTLTTLPDTYNSAVAHTRPDKMEWRMTTMRFATVESAELANSMLIGAGYNCALRQSRSFGGSNPFTRTVSAPPRAIDAAGGAETFAQLLKKQLEEECNPDVTVAVRPASSAAPPKFVLKFSTLGGVDQARGKFSVFQDMDKLCDI